MADSPEEIRKHTKAYYMVGLVLLFGTVLTVAVAKGPEFFPTLLGWMDVGAHGLSVGDIILGLFIAIFKASCVALIFMHLNAEKPLIYKFLLFTMFFFFGLMFLSLFEVWDPIRTRFFGYGS